MTCRTCQMACYDLLDQTLDAGAEKAVLDHIGNCPACRAFLEAEGLRMRTWPRLLGTAAGGNAIPKDAAERVAHALDVSHGRNRLRWTGKSRNRLPRPFRGLLALAASLLLLAGAGWMMRHARSSGPGGSGRIVAHTVTGVRSRRIRLVSQTGACGVELPDAAAGTIRLNAGLARILLPAGVELTLQGPIELHVLGEMEVRLRHGSVLAWVPQRAHGFIVRAPGLTALDLGTVFSVSADPTGTSRLFVFQGQVQALNDEGGNIAVCEAGSGVTRSAGCAPLPFALESGVAHARFEQVAGLAALTDPAETFSAVERIAREADVAARTIPAQDEVRNTKAENNTEDAMNSTRAIVLAGTLAVWNGMGAATTWHVAPEGDDAAAGASWEAPFKTISNAVAKAAIADEIVVSNGVYAVTVPVNVSKMLTVRALSSDPRDTIIDGGGVTNCVRLTATNTLFCGFTVSNGCWNGRPYGAGVYIEKGGVVSNCVITCCYAAWEENYGTHIGGGGLYTDYGVVTDCEISHNFVTNGCGGGVHMSGGNSSLKRCRIFGNRCTSYSSKSESGGGVYASGARVEACEIFDNRARKEGGGAALNSTAVLSLCLITGNQTEMTGGLGGGGVSTRGTGAFVTDCVISNNLAVGAGGGVYMIGDCVISNCFIERNSATGQGGGISSYLSAGYGLVSHTFIRNNTSTAADGGGVYFQRPASRLTMRNCLIEKNESVTGSYGGACGVGSNVLFMSCTVVTNRSKYAAGGIYLGNHTAYNTTGSVVSNCLVFGNVNQSGIAEVGSAFTSDMENFHYCFASNNVLAAYGVGNVSGDPMLENFAEGDYRLKPGSPCCNAGAYDSWMTGAVDLRGSRRICGPKVDIGAYERFYLLGTAIQVR